MQPKRKPLVLALVALAALLLLALLWVLGGGGDGRKARRGERAGDRAAAEDPRVERPEDVARQGEAPEPAEVEPLAAAVRPDPRGGPPSVDPGRGPGAYAFGLVVRVLDGNDHALPGARVFLGPLAHTLDKVGVAGLDGTVVVPLRAHVERLELALAAVGPRRTWSGLRRVEVVAGEAREIRLVMPREQVAERSADGSVELLRRAVRDGAPAERIARMVDRMEEQWAGRSPAGILASPQASQEDGACLFAARGSSGGGEAFRASWEELMSRYAEPSESASRPVLRGRLIDAGGLEAAGALVALGRRAGEVEHVAPADELGRYEVAAPAGEWHVDAGGGPWGRAGAEVSLHGDGLRLDLVLDRGAELQGDLFDAHGEPLAGWTLELVGETRALEWSAVAAVGHDGRYAFPNVGAGDLTLLVRSTADMEAFPWADLPVDAGLGWTPLVLPDEAPAVLDLRVRPVPGRSRREEPPALRLWQRATGRGIFVDRARPIAVPPGEYELEVGTEEGGWSVRRFSLSPGEEKQLDVRPLEGGTVTWTQSFVRVRSELELVELRPDVNSLVARWSVRPERVTRLPAGVYEVTAVVEGVPRRRVRFEVEEGKEHSVPLPVVE